jgi:hypothetical protein
VQISGDSPLHFRDQSIRSDRHCVTFDDLPIGDLVVGLQGWWSNEPDGAFGMLTSHGVTLKSGETTTMRFDKTVKIVQFGVTRAFGAAVAK